MQDYESTLPFSNHVNGGLLPQLGSISRFDSGSTVLSLDISTSGNITNYGTWTPASDEMLKDDIENVSLDDCQTLFEAVMSKTFSRRCLNSSRSPN